MNCQAGKLSPIKCSRKVGDFENPVATITVPPFFRNAVQKLKVPWLKRYYEVFCSNHCVISIARITQIVILYQSNAESQLS